MPTIYNQHGKEIIRLKPPVRSLSTVQIRDRWGTYPANGLTTQCLAQILCEGDQGDLQQSELFSQMEERLPDGEITVPETVRIASMKIFISWSGNTSRLTAIAMKDWLRKVLQSSTPYVSAKDIDKGARWFDHVSKELEDSQYGILCLTRDNLSSNWIHFEAGALAKNINKSKVAPILFGVTTAMVKPPLSQFQLVNFTKDDIFQLVEGLNNVDSRLPDPELREIFEVWWPKLEEKVQVALAEQSNSEEWEAHRSERELLEEVLNITRVLSKESALHVPVDDVAQRVYVDAAVDMLKYLSTNGKVVGKRLTKDLATKYSSKVLGKALSKLRKQGLVDYISGSKEVFLTALGEELIPASSDDLPF